MEPEGPGWLARRDEEAEGNDTELKKERDTEVKSGTYPPPCLGCSTGSMRGLPCHLAPTGVPAQGVPPAAGPPFTLAAGHLGWALEGVERSYSRALRY